MTKISGLIVSMLAFVVPVFAQNIHPDKVIGKWQNEAKDVNIEIFKSDNKYYGKMIWAKIMFETDGKTSKKDRENSDAKLRNRELKNLVFITNLTYDDNEYTGGQLYDAKTGSTYSCKMELAGEKLKTRGYKGVPMFGKTFTWTRIE